MIRKRCRNDAVISNDPGSDGIDELCLGNDLSVVCPVTITTHYGSREERVWARGISSGWSESHRTSGASRLRIHPLVLLHQHSSVAIAHSVWVTGMLCSLGHW